MPLDLTDAERDVLATHGIVLFEDRAILDAQPPLDEETQAELEARIDAPLPPGLLALWRASFGGRLDYRLTIDVDGTSHALALRELFFPISGAYRDLFGWIDHEAEDGELDYLPFGGFEFLDRLYVKVRGGDIGAVYAWKDDGLPESLPDRLRDEPIARVADDVPALFRQLAYERDPFQNADEFAPGLDLVTALGTVAASGAAGASAAEKLLAAIAQQTLDWRPALADGSIVRAPALRDIALETAAGRDDVETLERLDRLGCELDRELDGGSTPVEIALAASAWRATRFLLDRNANVTRTLPAVASRAEPELVAELLIRGADPSLEAALDAAAAGRDANAVLIARAYLARRRTAVDELVALAGAWATDAEESAGRLTSAGRSTPAAIEAYQSRARHLRRLAGLAPKLAAGVVSDARP